MYPKIIMNEVQQVPTFSRPENFGLSITITVIKKLYFKVHTNNHSISLEKYCTITFSVKEIPPRIK